MIRNLFERVVFQFSVNEETEYCCEYRRCQQAAETCIEGSDHCTVRNELGVNSSQTAGSTGSGADQTAEDHGSSRVVQLDLLCDQRSDDHRSDGLDGTGSDGQSDDVRADTEGSACDRADNESLDTGTDRSQFVYISVTEDQTDNDADNEGEDETESQEYS